MNYSTFLCAQKCHIYVYIYINIYITYIYLFLIFFKKKALKIVFTVAGCQGRGAAPPRAVCSGQGGRRTRGACRQTSTKEEALALRSSWHKAEPQRGSSLPPPEICFPTRGGRGGAAGCLPPLRPQPQFGSVERINFPLAADPPRLPGAPF